MPTWTPGTPGAFGCVQPGWLKEGPGLLGKGVEQGRRDDGTGLVGSGGRPAWGEVPLFLQPGPVLEPEGGLVEGALGERLWVSRLLIPLHLYP